MSLKNHFYKAKAGLFGVLLFAMTAGNAAMAQIPEEMTDLTLQKKLETLIQDFRGDVGIFVKHVPTGRIAAIRADELFPTASMIKVPIMLTLFDKIERGELEYGAEMTYLDTTIYAGDDGIVASLKDSTKIALSKLVMLMITTSDNSASLWCQALAGTGTEINRWLAENGFEQTRVNSRTPDRREGYQAYGWGQTTPREMAGLLELIRRGQAVSADASEEMYRILTRIYWNSEALSEIPPYVQAASKQGAVNQSRFEVVLVNAPSGDYVFCVITKNQADTSWQYDNEGFVLLRQVSKLLWQYFEPESTWQPGQNQHKWAK